jgi:hypothetical protein
MASGLKYKLLIGGVLGLVVIGLIVGAVRPSKQAMGALTAAPDVEVVKVVQDDVPIYGQWIGTLDGLVNADVRAQVTGICSSKGIRRAHSSNKASFCSRLTRGHFRQRSIRPRANWRRQRLRSPTPRQCKAAPNLMSSATRP